MKVILEGKPKEIAALVLELQGRRVVISPEDIIQATDHLIQVDLSHSQFPVKAVHPGQSK